MSEKETRPVEHSNTAENIAQLGDDVIALLRERTENPSEAFILLQRLSILLWYQYKIDWTEKEGESVAPTPKQRYLDFVSQLIDILLAENEACQK